MRQETALNKLTAAYARSTFDGSEYCRSGLSLNLSEVATAVAGQSVDGVSLFADTIVIDQTVHLGVPSISIVAREVQVLRSDLSIAFDTRGIPDATFQLTTWSVSGSVPLRVAALDKNSKIPDQPAVLAATGDSGPQVITVTGSAPSQAETATDSAAIAETLGQTSWVMNALHASFQAAATLIHGSDQDKGIAMLRWVIGCCAAISSQQSEAANLQRQSAGLLLLVSGNRKDLFYVPVLSSDFYKESIEGLLPIIESYSEIVDRLDQENGIEKTFAAFAETLGGVANQSAETTLRPALGRILDEAQTLRDQAINVRALYDVERAKAKALAESVKGEIERMENSERIKLAIDVLVELADLSLAASAVLLDDPAAMTEAGKTIKKAFTEGEQNADSLAKNGQQACQLLYDLAKGGYEIWHTVRRLYEDPQANLDDIPLPSPDSLPDEGIDASTYWEDFIERARDALRPAVEAKVGDAAPYLSRLEVLTVYGESLADKQTALIRLQGEAMSALEQLQAAQQAERSWNDLAQQIEDKQQQREARKGLIRQRLNDLKRSLLLAVERYRAAYRYKWLEDSGVQIDLNASYPKIEAACKSMKTDLGHLLEGNGPAVRPPQDFAGVIYRVPVDRADWVTPAHGTSAALHWQIGIEDPRAALSTQLEGHQALYITSIEFRLEGAVPDRNREVQATISTSGHYDLRLSNNPPVCHFVSKAISLDNIYRQNGNYVTRWEIDKAEMPQYLRPSPYTQWTLEMKEGWQSVTAVEMKLSGVYLRDHN